MKLKELIEKLQRYETDHPGTDVCIESLVDTGKGTTNSVVEIVRIGYGSCGDSHACCMVSIADPLTAEAVRNRKHGA